MADWLTPTGTPIGGSDLNRGNVAHGHELATLGRTIGQGPGAMWSGFAGRMYRHDGTGVVVEDEVSTPFTPTWDFVTLGTGATVGGEWRRRGYYVAVQGWVTLGTGGAVTGAVAMSLPHAAHGTEQGAFGLAGVTAIDASTAKIYALHGRVHPIYTTWFQLFDQPASSLVRPVAAAVPFTWAVGDQVRAHVLYRMADPYL